MSKVIKTATVAAAFSEVAKKIIEQLICENTNVVGFARIGDEKRAEEMEAKYSGKLKIILGDLASLSDAKRMVDEAVEHLGEISAHYHCAGVYSWNHWADVTPEEVHRLFNANFQTAWSASKALIPAMIGDERRSIVFASARDTARFIPAGFGPYMASKMALNGLVESMASELIETNISVTAVLPTIIDTKVNREAIPDLDPSYFVDPAQMAGIMIDISRPDRFQMSGSLITINSKLI